MKLLIETKTALNYLPRNHRVFSIENEDDRQANVDWNYYKEIDYTNRNVFSAQKQAIKLSEKPEIYSVHIVAQAEDDPVFQEFYENGKCCKIF